MPYGRRGRRISVRTRLFFWFAALLPLACILTGIAGFARLPINEWPGTGMASHCRRI
jgi:hypothetical protein